MGAYPKYLVKGELKENEKKVLVDFISKHYYEGWGSFSNIFDYGITEIDINVIRDYIESKLSNEFGYVHRIVEIMRDNNLNDIEKIGEIKWIIRDMNMFVELFELFCVLKEKLRIVSDYVEEDYDGWKVVDVKCELVEIGDE